MGFFDFFAQGIAIDLGTANTIIIHNDQIVVDEPSYITIETHTKKVHAIGEKAKQMYGKTHDTLRTIRPLRDGVIADFDATEKMIRSMIKLINLRKGLFRSHLRMIICIPSGSTEVEIRAVRDSAEHSGAKEVIMIYEPMAAAIGNGIDVQSSSGNMVVDIGGGTSEIAVLSLGGIVINKSIRIAGDEMNADIVDYMKQQHNMRIGERTAEEIKIQIGSTLTELDDPPEDYVVHGAHQITALPIEVVVSYKEMAMALDKTIIKIERAILEALEATPPELYSDIIRNGIYLAGGGALLRGLDKRLTKKLGIKFHVADDPLWAVARGTSIALKNLDTFQFLIR